MMRSMSKKGTFNGSEHQHITRMVQAVYSCTHRRPLLEVGLWLFFFGSLVSLAVVGASAYPLTLSEWNGRLV